MRVTDQCSDCAHCHGVEIKVDFDGPGDIEPECDMESVMTDEDCEMCDVGKCPYYEQMGKDEDDFEIPEGEELVPQEFPIPNFDLTFAEAIQGMMEGFGMRYSCYPDCWFQFIGPTLMQCYEAVDILGTKYIRTRSAEIVKIMTTGKWMRIIVPKEDPVCSGVFLGEMERMREKCLDLEKDAKRFDMLSKALNDAYTEFEEANPAEPNPYEKVVRKFYGMEEAEE